RARAACAAPAAARAALLVNSFADPTDAARGLPARERRIDLRSTLRGGAGVLHDVFHPEALRHGGEHLVPVHPPPAGAATRPALRARRTSSRGAPAATAGTTASQQPAPVVRLLDHALKLVARVFDLSLELAQGLRRLSAKGGKNIRSSSAWHTGPPLVDRMSRIKVKWILLQAGEWPVATTESCFLREFGAANARQSSPCTRGVAPRRAALGVSGTPPYVAQGPAFGLRSRDPARVALVGGSRDQAARRRPIASVPRSRPERDELRSDAAIRRMRWSRGHA